MKNKKQFSSSLFKGFTLVELMVSVGIILIMTSIVGFNHSRFGNSIVFTNLAFDVALAVRESQVYGITVRGSDESFQVGYGVHFDKNKPTEFTRFVDTDGNKVFNEGSDQTLETYKLTRGNTIGSVCAVLADGSENCSAEFFDITFLRPDPDAIFARRSGVGSFIEGVVSAVKINIVSPEGMEKTIRVESTGQISVE